MKERNETQGRVLQLIDALHTNVASFQKDCGLGDTFVLRVTRNVRKRNLEKINARYPQVNINWLKTGVGDMFSKPESDGTTIKDRLQRFIRLKGYSVRKFEAAAGLAAGTLSKVNNNMRTGTVLKIKRLFPDLSEDWLLYNRGDMISKEISFTTGGSIKDRMRLFVEYLGVSEPFFLNHVGSGVRRISDINDSVPISLLEAIHDAYPDLNMKWLRAGEQPMVLETKRNSPDNVVMIPVVSQLAYAGYLCGFADAEYMSSLPTIPFVAGLGDEADSFIAFEVSGDSMDDDTPDAYKNGDILICKRVELQLYRNSSLPFKRRDFVIVHKDGILIKRIVAHDVENHTITIHSLSDDPTYTDKVLDLRDVRQLFTVEYQQRKRSR